MTKLEWGRGYTPDPARVRSVEDFSNPDNVIISVTPIKKKRKKLLSWEEWEEGKQRKKQAKEAARKAVADTHRAAQIERSNKAKKAQSAEEVAAKQATKAERRAAMLAHNERYLSKTKRQRQAIEKKKRSHLQHWVDGQEGLREERRTLLQRWKARLLKSRPLEPS